MASAKQPVYKNIHGIWYASCETCYGTGSIEERVPPKPWDLAPKTTQRHCPAHCHKGWEPATCAMCSTEAGASGVLSEDGHLYCSTICEADAHAGSAVTVQLAEVL